VQSLLLSIMDHSLCALDRAEIAVLPLSGGGLAAAMKVCAEVKDAVIVHVVCDRGDRYLSTGVFPA